MRVVPRRSRRGGAGGVTLVATATNSASDMRGTAMKQRRLGRTGLKVSELCLGTMTFGAQADETTSFAILDRAAEGGIHFIDTADVYPVPVDAATVGRTEEIVGKWLRGRREVFI